METGLVKIQEGSLVLAPEARQWCRLPYPGHPQGCPNFGKRSMCPPQAPTAKRWLKGTSNLYLTYVRFDLAAHIRAMLTKHPGWSERQARCVLYWQGGVNKVLRHYTSCLVSDTQFWLSTNPRKVTYCPEAMGIDVITTANRNKLPVEKRPTSYVYKIAIMAEEE